MEMTARNGYCHLSKHFLIKTKDKTHYPVYPTASNIAELKGLNSNTF